MSRHKLYLDSPTQVGKNRITLPKALADYYGNTAQAFVNGRQVESKAGGYALSFDGNDDRVFLDSCVTTDYVDYEAVVKINSFTGIGMIISTTGHYHYAYPSHGCLGVDGDGKVIFVYRDVSETYTICTGTTVLETGRLYTLRAYSDTNGIKVFVDGVEDGNISTNLTNASNSYPPAHTLIGFNYKPDSGYTDSLFFNGKIYYIKVRDVNTNTTIHEYKFNEGTGTTLTDSAGSNNGTITGATWEFSDEIKTDNLTFTTPTPTREIEIGRGNLELASVDPDAESVNVAYFPGSINYLSRSSFYGSANMTVELWTKFDSLSDGWIINKRDSSEYCWQVFIHENELGFICKNVGNTGEVVFLTYATSNLQTDVWYHIAGTTDGVSGGTAKLYVNRVEVDSDTLTADMETTEDCSLIVGMPGWDLDAESLRFDGYISDIRIWNKQLSKEELALKVNGNENGLIAWYPLEGDSLDYAGNYDLTNNGNVTYSTWTSKPIPIKTPEVLHWTPSSDIGWYWVLTEDGNGIFVKAEGTWIKGVLFVKLNGEWVECEPKVRDGGVWL